MKRGPGMKEGSHPLKDVMVAHQDIQINLNDGYGCELLFYQWILLHEPTAFNNRNLLLRAVSL